MATKRLLYLVFAVLVFAAAILAATKPTITSFSPANATAGGAAFTLTVNGTGYASGAIVKWNGSDRTTTFVSATQVTAQITAADFQVGGVFPITIRNTTGAGSDPVNYTVNNPVPTLTSISPTSATAAGATFTLTVTGTNFNSSSLVRFNGNNKTTTFVSATQLTAQITSSDIQVAGTYPITINNPTPGGGTSSPVNIIINNPVPAVTSVSPSTTTVGGAAFTLTVNGSNFVNGSVVSFGGSNRTTTFVNATRLSAQILASDLQVTGTSAITVQNAAPGGGTSGAVDFTVVNPVPTLTSISPASKTLGDADFTLTLNGSNFVNGAQVLMSGVGLPTTFVSSTQLTAQVTSANINSAGTRLLVVSNPSPGGGTSAAVNFTVNNPTPTLSSLSQTSAIAGDAAFNVTVSGSNFVGGSVIRFNGHDCATTYEGSTQLSAQIAAAEVQVAGLFPVTVLNPLPGGGVSGALDFTVNNPFPTLSSISPTSATAGQAGFTVTITGTNFNGSSVVRFNGSDRPTSLVSSTELSVQLTATDIAAAGVFPLTVANPAPGGGTSSAIDFTVNNPVPAVNSISPATAMLGGDALILTVNGSSFVNGSVVRFNGNDRTTTFVDATQLTAQILGSDLQVAGTFGITVFNPTPGGGTSAAVEFAVNNPAPTLGSISPSSVVVGDSPLTLTVTGNDFVNGAVVRFNGSDRTTSFVSSTELTMQPTATDLQSAGVFPLTVTNPAPGGGVSAALDFTVSNPVPALSSILPASKTAGGADFTITVNGSNFVSSSLVQFNGTDRATIFVSATELTAQLTAADIQVGGLFPITVVNPAPGGGVSSAVDLTVNNPAPILSSISPASATAGDAGLIVALNGTEFNSSSVVRFNGVDQPTSFVSNTELTVQLTAADIQAAGAFPFTVFNAAPGGGTSTAVDFTVNNPAPSLSSIAPSSATAGGAAFTLTVNGSGFVNGSVVSFNGSDRLTTLVSGSQLNAEISATDIQTVGTADIVVFNPLPSGGSSAAVGLAIESATPILATLSPSSVLQGGPGLALSITGTGFNTGSVVRFNGSDRPTTFVSGIALSAQLTAADTADVGQAEITVLNPAPGGLSNALPFAIDYNPALHRIVQVPDTNFVSGENNSITIGFEAQGDENALAFSLNFDTSKMSFVSAAVGADASAGGVNVNLNQVDQGRVGLVIALPTGETFTSGHKQILVVTFNVPASSLGSTSIDFVDQPVEREVVDSDASALGATYSSGSISIQYPTPILAAISPASATAGEAGFILTVSGTKFIDGAVVRLNGSDRPTTFVSSNQLTAEVTAADVASAGFEAITVLNPAPTGGSSNAIGFTVNNPAPTLSSISPTSATAGDAALTVVINGSNFVNGTVVRFNGSDRPASFVSSTEVTAQLTAADIQAAGSFSLTVANPAPGGGVSSAVDFTVNNPAPNVGSISPTSAIAGEAGFTLTISGANFNSSSVALFNGNARPTSFVSATELTAQVTAADIQAAGMFSLTVANPAPGGGTSSAVELTVNNPAPTMSSISPSSATAGDATFTLTVNGTNFNSGSIVRFNGNDQATTFVSASELQAQITATEIQTAGVFAITVVNAAPGGGVSSAIDFSVSNPVPAINNLSPTNATAGEAALTVTISGHHFINGAVVRFNSSDRPTSFVSATELTVQLAAADIQAAGVFPLTVANPAADGGVSATFGFTVNNPAPAVSSISPTSAIEGQAGFTLTISGANFNSSSVVRFNGNARPTSFVSATELTAQLTAADIQAAGMFSLTVANPAPGGGTSSAVDFTVNNPAPTVSSISPTSAIAGEAGFTLTISGANFNSSSVVRFNGNARPTSFVSATELTAQVTAADIQAAGMFSLTVANPAPGGGVSSAVELTVNNPAPTMSSISPSSAIAGDATFTLTVNGTNFNSGSIVRFNGNDQATTFVSASELQAQITATEIQTAGVFAITVVNSAPGGGVSSAIDFSVSNPVPAINNISPTNATAGSAALTVTISGHHFVNGAVVRLNSSDRPTSFVSATELTAQLTAADIQAAGSFSLTVANPAPGGGVSSAVDFTVNNPAPTVNSISPTSAIEGQAGFTLTISGANFNSSSVVRFNGNARPTSFISATELTAQLTAADIQAAGSFSLTVANPAPGGGVSSAVDFTVNNPAPTVNSISPTSAIAGEAGFTLTISGANFNSSSVVRFNGNARPTSFVSATELTAQLTAADIQAAGSFSLTVANPAPGGGVSSAVELTVNNPAPTMSSISPSSAIAGDATFTLTVNGTNFNSGSIVRFNGNNQATTFVSASELQAQITATEIQTAGVFAITVVNSAPGGGVSSAIDFSVSNPVPAINNISPTNATAGSAALTVTISGHHFVNGAVVRFNGSDRPTSFVSATELTAQLAAADIQAAGSFSLTVANPAPGGGVSSAVDFTVNNPAPAVSSISPTSAIEGQAGFTLTISGANFNSSSVVRFNGNARPTSFVSATELTAQVTAADIQAAGMFSLTVANPAPGGGVSSAVELTVNNPAPTMSSISHSSAIAGDATFTLTVNGTNFNSGSIVRFNGNDQATTFVSASELQAQITATEIQTAGVFAITVVNAAPGGGVSSAIDFSVSNPVPVVNTVSPSNILAGSADPSLTIHGAGFNNGSIVRWNADARSTTFVSSTQLTARLTAADVANSGIASVTVNNSAPGGGTSNAVTVNVDSNPRKLSIVNMSASSNSTVTIPVQFEAQGDENILHFSLTFDTTLLSNPHATLGSDAAGATLNTETTQTAQGRYGITLSLPTGQNFVSGTRQVVNVTFTTAAIATQAATQVGFGDQPLGRDVLSSSGESLPTIYMPGTLTVLLAYEADVSPRPDGSGNGVVSISDWVQLGRFAAGMDTAKPGSEFQRADCAPRNTLGSGSITLADWVQAGRYSAGLDPVRTAGGPTGQQSETAAQIQSVEVPTSNGAAASTTVRLPGADLSPGQKNSLSIEVDSQGNENALGFSLLFDPAKLSFVSAEKGDLSAATLNVNLKEAGKGRIGIALALPAGQTFGAGTHRVVLLNFTASADVSEASLLHFTDKPIAREVVDVDGNTMKAIYQEPTALGSNPIDDAQFFVTQQYEDFLSRTPDVEGLAYWTEQLRQCGEDVICMQHRRRAVSAAFFVEQEFQQTGYVVYRLYRAAFGQRPSHAQFLADRTQLIGGPQLPASTVEFANQFVTRAEFQQAYPETLTAAEFVDKLFETAGLSLAENERHQAIEAMTSKGETRAQILLRVIAIKAFKEREYNPAFVLMQYFGYLRRDPDKDGFLFWLDVLNNREPGNYSGLVCAFITSAEYQLRFGPLVSHSNAECGQ